MNSSLDTNILLRYIWDDVPGQCERVKKLLKDDSQVLHISDLVVAEVIFNLQTREPMRARIVEIIESIFALPNIAPNSFITDTVLPYYAAHPALSFVDCYAALEAEKKGWEPLWTFDRKLANQCPGAKRA